MNKKGMKKYKTGYTTGVFDLFHIGHLNILEKAKAQCDYLIVGISTDELVKQYKGKQPIDNFEERVAIVSAIKYVDKVVPQISLDKMVAWRELHYDVLFHGSDWKGSEMYNQIEESLAKENIAVIYFPQTTGISSTMRLKVISRYC